MEKLRKTLVCALLLVAVFGFLAAITEMPTSSASAGGTYCDEGASLYCWTSFPNWACLLNQGGISCVDPEI